MYSTSQFEQLFKKHFPSMYALALGMLHDPDESRDAVHEVFANLWEKQPDVDPGAEKSYLLLATRNQCISIIRQKSQEEQMRQMLHSEQNQPQLPDAMMERWNSIQQYMEKEMPPDTRQVIQLCFEQRLTYRQAADQLQQSIGYVNKQIVRGLRLLRDKFNPQ